VNWTRWALYPLGVLAGLALVGAAVAAFVVILAYDNLPSIEALTDYRPKVPLRIYTADGTLIGEFGEERRTLVRLQDVPPVLKQAILAAEDTRFYQHTGVDFVGVARAALANFASGRSRQGASTITMQVARNMFLTPERTFSRKINEILLAFKIESTLGKDQILEIYINQIYLGQRAFGFAAAAQAYFAKPIGALNLGEAAMLAGLPKAPSSINPIANPKRARARQLWVLGRMEETGEVNPTALAAARAAPPQVRPAGLVAELHAEHVAEMVRQAMHERYPGDLYTRGYRVYTTLTRNDQAAAWQAVRRGLIDYDHRHGYRGPERQLTLPAGAGEDEFDDLLGDAPIVEGIESGIVLEASTRQVKVWLRGGDTITVQGDGLRFAARALEPSAGPALRIRRGSLVRLAREDKIGWAISQLPDVEAALVSVNPADGAVRALVGGFDFGRNKFNHVTQAWRQPGSSFKPFIYSAALEHGFNPASIIDDSPITVSPALTGGQAWEPKNYDRKFDGPMRMRTALALSKNLVSVRILQAIGPQYAQDYITRFGFEPEKHPPYLTLALGAGSVTPLQMARGYSTFANEGYLVEPYLIGRVVDDHGTLLAEARPARAGGDARQVIDERNAFLMDSMLRSVVRNGTGARALSLGRTDLAGKTGTTNEFVDAWFCGYQATQVAVVWVGYDTPRKLGETGGVAALPIWMSYMSQALRGVPESSRAVPDGVMSVQINGATGLEDPRGDISEYFYRDHAPGAADAARAGASGNARVPEVVEGSD
jgi:penicillin-binding protein 1A